MKKTIIGFVVLLSMLLMVGTASAQNITWGTNTKVHYNFNLTTTEGCASCHVTHTASVAKLLWGTYNSSTPATQTAFCYVCHAGTIASPYDVERGIISPDEGTTETASWAGKFAFDTGSYTSRHDVENTITAVVADKVYSAIPGNKLAGAAGTISGGFKCASCHDPHGGDLPNDRLLKEKPLPGNAVVNGVNFTFDAAKMAVTDYASSAAENTALNNWCGQCHGKFNVTGDAGKVMGGGDTLFRHPMGVDVNPTAVSIAVYLGNKAGGAVDGKNLLNCLTCHAAHGVDTVAHDTAQWYRDDGSLVNADATSSLLLRLDKRGVCYDCHGAATKNLEDLTTFNLTGNH